MMVHVQHGVWLCIIEAYHSVGLYNFSFVCRGDVNILFLYDILPICPKFCMQPQQSLLRNIWCAHSNLIITVKLIIVKTKIQNSKTCDLTIILKLEIVNLLENIINAV
ncbi:hypothetical protein J6590_010159 [Homalodisca vitripennis]|nr:hypothetical protein J6590_010159 [Homalodisca vitripennis]